MGVSGPSGPGPSQMLSSARAAKQTTRATKRRSRDAPCLAGAQADSPCVPVTGAPETHTLPPVAPQ